MTLLGGRYEALKAIASGGMATVHLGRAIGVGGFERLVAIKLMHAHIAAEDEFVEMFLDEARLAARIRHPNVVATIDVQESPDGLFLVMEYVEGPSLRRLQKVATKRKVRLPPEVVLRVMVDALAGLHAAHELLGDDGQTLNLIHRDVSPANILVGVDGVSRLTDFGVARAETRLSSTRGGKLKGKIPYMPPEQLMGSALDRRCDVYAAGVVLWESLSGRRLFSADNEGALLQRVLAGPSHTLREVVPDIPAALDAVCMQALSHAPGERHQSAAAFADALEDAAGSAGISVASTRKVAKYVEQSGAHEKFDIRELAALKKASGLGVPAPRSSAASLPTFPSQTDVTPLSSPQFSSAPISNPGQPVPSTPSVPSMPSFTSQPSVASVTATEATYSARPDTRSSSRVPAIAIGVVVAVLGLGGGYFLSQRGASTPATEGAADESPVDGADEASTAVGDGPEAQPAPDDSEPVGSASEEALAASAAASADAAASASAATQPVPPAHTGPVVAPPPRHPPKPKPKPKSGPYNPNRL